MHVCCNGRNNTASWGFINPKNTSQWKIVILAKKSSCPRSSLTKCMQFLGGVAFPWETEWGSSPSKQAAYAIASSTLSTSSFSPNPKAFLRKHGKFNQKIENTHTHTHTHLQIQHLRSRIAFRHVSTEFNSWIW